MFCNIPVNRRYQLAAAVSTFQILGLVLWTYTTQNLIRHGLIWRKCTRKRVLLLERTITGRAALAGSNRSVPLLR